MASRNNLDLRPERLRREAAVPPHAERAFRAVEGHDPAQDLEAVLAGPHDAGSQELRRTLRLGEVHDRLVAVLLELAVTERGHRPGRLGLRHTRSATTACAIRPPLSCSFGLTRIPPRKRISIPNRFFRRWQA